MRREDAVAPIPRKSVTLNDRCRCRNAQRRGEQQQRLGGDIAIVVAVDAIIHDAACASRRLRDGGGRGRSVECWGIRGRRHVPAAVNAHIVSRKVVLRYDGGDGKAVDKEADFAPPVRSLFDSAERSACHTAPDGLILERIVCQNRIGVETAAHATVKIAGECVLGKTSRGNATFWDDDNRWRTDGSSAVVASAIVVVAERR